MSIVGDTKIPIVSKVYSENYEIWSGSLKMKSYSQTKLVSIWKWFFKMFNHVHSKLKKIRNTEIREKLIWKRRF